MQIQAKANQNQINEVDITMTITMTMAQWMVIHKGLRNNDYNHVKTILASHIEDVIGEFKKGVEKEITIQ